MHSRKWKCALLPGGCYHMLGNSTHMPQSLQGALSQHPGALTQAPDLAGLCCPAQWLRIAEMSARRMHSVACRAAQLRLSL